MASPESRPFSLVFGSIVENTQDIIRSEVRLAKVEIREELTATARSVIILAMGLVFGLYALGFGLLAAIYALSLTVEPWLAALIVAGAVGVIAMALIASGKGRLKQVNPPSRTIETMKENIQWAKHRIK